MTTKTNFFQSGFYVALIVICLMLSSSLKAQSDGYKKNSIYLSYGNIITADQLSISYERLIFEKNRLRTKAKVNYGNYLNNNSDYAAGAKVYQNYFSFSAVQLIGPFEMNAGIARTQFKLAAGFDPQPTRDYNEIKKGFDFYGAIGLRFEKEHFLIRFGIGNVELAYVGIGLNF